MEEGNFVGDHDYLMMVCVDHDQRRFRLGGVMRFRAIEFGFGVGSGTALLL